MARAKICGITNLDDAAWAAECGAFALGFNFYTKSPRFISPELAGQIIAALPGDVLEVGVFVNHSIEDVVNAVHRSGINAVQLHGDEDSGFIQELRRYTDLPVIRAVRIAAGVPIRASMAGAANAVLLDTLSSTGYGGTGRAFPWEIARDAGLHIPGLYLAGGLTPENVAEAVRVVRPAIVDAASGVESAKGRKDPVKVKDFIDNAGSAK